MFQLLCKESSYTNEQWLIANSWFLLKSWIRFSEKRKFLCIFSLKPWSMTIVPVKVSSPKSDDSASPKIIESVSVRMCAVTHNIITWTVPTSVIAATSRNSNSLWKCPLILKKTLQKRKPKDCVPRCSKRKTTARWGKLVKFFQTSV